VVQGKPVVRKQQYFRQRLQHILRHAARLFREKGYDGASIRDISRASGVPLSSLYYYCRSKQELLYRIEIFTFSRILERLDRRLAGVRDPAERLRVLVRNHLDYFLEFRDEMKVLAHEDDSLAGSYRREVAEIKRRYYRKALEIFGSLSDNGGARRLSPRVAVLSLFGMMNWVYTWHKPKLDPGAGELAGAISAIFLNGVRHQSAAILAPQERRLPSGAGRLPAAVSQANS
jgi:AcrR family transcriptional regulator